MIDITKLEPPKICEQIEFEEIFSQIKEDFKKEMPELTITDADPVTKLLRVFAYRETLAREKINMGARAVWLAYSWGEYLDELGKLFDEPRKAKSDDEYREAIRLKLDKIPEGQFGTDSHYRVTSLGVGKIIDAQVIAEAINVVRVVVLKKAEKLFKDGKISEIVSGAPIENDDIKELSEVQNELIKSNIKALTHKIEVEAAIIGDYKIEIKLLINSNDPSKKPIETIKNAVIDWMIENHKLNKLVSLSTLHKAILNNPIISVNIIEPKADLKPRKDTAWFCKLENITITETGDYNNFYGGSP